MFDASSRYDDLEMVTTTTEDGREVRYVRRRFLPPPVTETEVFAEHTVVQGERLDNITARYLGDPEQFWQLADANRAMHPDGLTAESGRTLRVPLPQIEGQS
jgi:hypothetical protein